MKGILFIMEAINESCKMQSAKKISIEEAKKFLDMKMKEKYGGQRNG